MQLRADDTFDLPKKNYFRIKQKSNLIQFYHKILFILNSTFKPKT
jgi:hypothetical protein